MAEPDLFWRYFASVCETHDTILQLIISLAPAQTAGCLRLVNTAMRVAVNRTVSTVACNLAGPRFEGELAAVFPQADKLKVDFRSCKYVAHVDVCFFLEYILAISPALVSKVVEVDLDMGSDANTEESNVAVASFLSRCTNLQQLTVTWRAGVSIEFSNGCSVQFHGPGSTAEERRRSMQLQLAAFCSSTAHFLAPASWAACDCLTSFSVTDIMSDTDVETVYLDAVGSTTSLVSLHVYAVHVSSFAPLDTLSSLQNLTLLRLITEEAGDEAPCVPVLEAIGQLSKLQHLSLDDGVLGYTGDAAAACIPASWSALQCLQHLELAHRSVSMPSLHPFTRLTCLEVTDSPEGQAADQPPSGSSGRTEVPQQWRDGLQRLAWGNCSRRSLGVLSQLTSLTVLHLQHPCVTPELCRVLGTLPLLADLCITDTTTTTQEQLHFNPDTSKYRPALPSLRRFAVRAMFSSERSTTSLHVLARWSDIPPAASLELEVASHLAVRGWGVGWLAAALSSSKRAWAVVLQDDDDIALYLAALSAARRCCAQLDGCEHTALLGTGVTPAGFSRLFRARLPCGVLHVGNAVDGHASQPYYLDWTAGLRLAHAHVKALAGASAPGLEGLNIADCSQLADWDIAVLVAAAPGLRHLRLGRAEGLTESAMYALLGCPLLVSVHLVSVKRMTAEGVAVALTLLRGLTKLRLDGQVQGWIAPLVARVTSCVAAVGGARWVSNIGAAADGAWATWARSET